MMSTAERRVTRRGSRTSTTAEDYQTHPKITDLHCPDTCRLQTAILNTKKLAGLTTLKERLTLWEGLKIALAIGIPDKNVEYENVACELNHSVRLLEKFRPHSKAIKEQCSTFCETWSCCQRYMQYLSKVRFDQNKDISLKLEQKQPEIKNRSNQKKENWLPTEVQPRELKLKQKRESSAISSTTAKPKIPKIFAGHNLSLENNLEPTGCITPIVSEVCEIRYKNGPSEHHKRSEPTYSYTPKAGCPKNCPRRLSVKNVEVTEKGQKSVEFLDPTPSTPSQTHPKITDLHCPDTCRLQTAILNTKKLDGLTTLKERLTLWEGLQIALALGTQEDNVEYENVACQLKHSVRQLKKFRPHSRAIMKQCYIFSERWTCCQRYEQYLSKLRLDHSKYKFSKLEQKQSELVNMGSRKQENWLPTEVQRVQPRPRECKLQQKRTSSVISSSTPKPKIPKIFARHNLSLENKLEPTGCITPVVSEVCEIRCKNGHLERHERPEPAYTSTPKPRFSKSKTHARRLLRKRNKKEVTQVHRSPIKPTHSGGRGEKDIGEFLEPKNISNSLPVPPESDHKYELTIEISPITSLISIKTRRRTLYSPGNLPSEIQSPLTLEIIDSGLTFAECDELLQNIKLSDESFLNRSSIGALSFEDIIEVGGGSL